MALNVKIDAFEGPFDLLFHLIEKNQIDIYDIPIAELTEQYLKYIQEIKESRLDTASEFLGNGSNSAEYQIQDVITQAKT